jgi:hypothetical protein
MNRYILSINDVTELVRTNIYLPEEDIKLQSRCMDGRYKEIKDLPALALPAGDIGDIATLYIAATSYGFEVDYEKAFLTFQEVIGGFEHLTRVNANILNTPEKTAQIDEIEKIVTDYASFSLTESAVSELKKQYIYIKDKQKNNVEITLDHKEGAIIMINGEYGVYPQCELFTENGRINTQVYVYHQTYANRRHQQLAKKLIETKSVVLYPGCDEEMLYDALIDTSENVFFEMTKLIAPELPLYSVEVDERQKIKIADMSS